MSLTRKVILSVFAYLLLAYLIAFVLVCIDPYWYDSSPRPEYIPWSDRWGWALVFWWYKIVPFGLPLVVVAIVIVICWSTWRNFPPR
jgi:hypothetical protein